MAELIVNADDFGLSDGANRGIIRAWQEGILTCTSLMPGGQSFDRAVEMARENPGLQVGLHLTLVQGRGVLPPDRIPDLVDADGNFTNNPVTAGMRYFFLGKLRPQLKLEIEAQITKILDAGLPLTHVDGHLNIHMQPVVFDILSELMPKYGITSFRLTREDLQANLAYDLSRKTGKKIDAFIFSSLSRRCRPILERNRISFAGEVRGLLNSGRMTEEYLLDTLCRLQAPLTEIYFHPGCLPCDEISQWMPDYRHEDELAALLSDRVKKLLVDNAITLRNYRGEVKRIC